MPNYFHIVVMSIQLGKTKKKVTKEREKVACPLFRAETNFFKNILDKKSNIYYNL